jgi:hypothetical protein
VDLPDRIRAIAAATSVAASLGLPASDAVVLQNSNKLALRLTPCDAFVGVAHGGQQGAEREVELALRLAEAGCPVARLDCRVDPHVYTRDGFAITLWTYYEPLSRPIPPADYARALEQLHAGLRKVDIPSPRLAEAGPVEFDLAHVPPAVCEHYPDFDQGLLDDCRQLVLAMAAACRWELGDKFPDGRRFGDEFLRLLRAGPPWPTLDAITA